MAQLRFAALNNGSGFIRAGQNINKEFNNIFETATAYSPDYGGLAQRVIDAESSKRKAATKAQADVMAQGIATTAGAKVNEIRTEADLFVKKKEIKSKMAGKLAAFGGTLAKTYTDKKDPPLPPAQVDPEDLRELDRDIYGDDNPESDAPNNSQPEKPEQPAQPAQATNEDANEESTPNPAPAVTPPASGELLPPLSRQQLRTYAQNAGFPESELDTVVAVALAESSGIPNNYNGKGDDDSYGIMQINMLDRPGYRMGTERRAAWGLENNQQLFDPQTNFNAAYDVWKSQGWGGWGAYTNGSYRQFL